MVANAYFYVPVTDYWIYIILIIGKLEGSITAIDVEVVCQYLEFPGGKVVQLEQARILANDPNVRHQHWARKLLSTS